MLINDLNSKKINLILLLRSLGITSSKVLSAIEQTPREEFLSNNQKKYAYENSTLPIGFDKFILKPFLIALMIEKINLNYNKKVLEIGTGCGYLSVILSKLVRNVYTVESVYPLLVLAKNNFKKLKITNIFSKHSDSFLGWDHMSPFDNLIMTCYIDKFNTNLFKQVKDGGKCIFLLKKNGTQILKCITVEKKNSNNKIEEICDINF